MNALDRFLAACRPTSVASFWFEDKGIDPTVADARGCRMCGHEFPVALAASDRAAFGTGINLLESWCSPSRQIGAFLIPYVRLGETIAIKAIPPREDVKPPFSNLTPMPWPLWIDDLNQAKYESNVVIVAWGEIAALKTRTTAPPFSAVIGLPGNWKTIWAPLFEGRVVVLEVPDGQREKIVNDMKANGAKVVS
jgi:hypothetical protein